MPPKAATQQKQVQCPYCSHFFKQLRSHISASRVCNAKWVADEYPDDSESSVSRKRIDSGVTHYNMDIDAETDEILYPGHFPDSDAAMPEDITGPMYTRQPQDNIHSFESTVELSAGIDSINTVSKTFSLHSRYVFPHAGKIFAKNQPTRMHTFYQGLSKEFLYEPFANKSEWSLVEWLGASGLSKRRIDELFKTEFVWIPFYCLHV